MSQDEQIARDLLAAVDAGRVLPSMAIERCEGPKQTFDAIGYLRKRT